MLLCHFKMGRRGQGQGNEHGFVPAGDGAPAPEADSLAWPGLAPISGITSVPGFPLKAMGSLGSEGSLMPYWFMARTLKTYDFPFSRSKRANLGDFTGVSVWMASQVPLPMTDCDKGEKGALVKQLPGPGL